MQIGERIEKGDIDEDFLNLAFSYILTVRQWNGKKLSYFADIVCNPATDYRAAALMISAAMLSSIKVFDYNMMTTLFDIWKKSKDVKISERALVGWSVIMMSVDSEQYPYIKEFIDKIKEDEKQWHTCLLSRSRSFSVWMLLMMLNNSVMMLCLPSLMISG